MSLSRHQWEAVSQARAMLQAGDTMRSVCTRLGITPGTLKRWMDAADMPDLPQERGSGRRPAIDLTITERNRLIFWRLCKDNSLPAAVREFLRDPVCRPETAEALEYYIRKARDNRKRVHFPPTLNRLTMPTAEEQALFRKKKNAQDYELVVPRGLTWVDEDGKEQPLLANTLWESDDMSVNQPFRWINPNTGKEEISRQALISIDVYSHFWLGVSLVGRPRDAYQAEDISDHFLQLVQSHGLPRAWRLERGSWESNFIDGIKLDDGSYWGGINSRTDIEGGLIAILHTWKSRGKGTIEGAFNGLQRWLSHTSTDIGRVRGEYDHAARQLRRAQHGQADALEQFWSIEECAAMVEAAMQADNALGKVRRAHGNLTVRADDLYPPQSIVPMPVSEIWRFLPVKEVRTVSKGAVTVKCPHWPKAFIFQVNHGGAPFFVPNSHKVFVVFHPGRPAEGAYIFNALQRQDPGNREGWKFGQLLTIAPVLAEAPQFSLMPNPDSRAQKDHNGAMRSAYRQIVKPGEHPGLKTSTARDGLGNALHVQAGSVRDQDEMSDALPTPADPARILSNRKAAREAAAPLPRPTRDTSQIRAEAERKLYGI